MKAIQVMIVDDSADARQSLRMLLELADGIDVIAEAKDGAEALNKLSVITPDVILMDLNMPVMDGVQATEKICLQYPNIAVIVVSIQNDVEYVRRCMRAGAKDYLFKPITVEQLTGSIEEVTQSERDRLTRNTVAVLSDRFAHRSRVLTFISAKGGVGKTTIAVNSAVAFAEQGKRVVYVDLDLQFGDASLFLNMTAPRTVADLVRESSEIDLDVLDRYLAPHTSGMSLLAAPFRPEEAEYVTSGSVRVILQALRKKFEYVVVDTSPLVNDVFFSILETADDWFMVNTLNLAVLKNNRMLLELLTELGYDRGRVTFLLNRASAKNGLKIKDVTKLLQGELFWEMDNDPAFAEAATNEGAPFLQRDKQHKLSKQIYALTARIEEQQGTRISRRNPLHKLFASRR